MSGPSSLTQLKPFRPQEVKVGSGSQIETLDRIPVDADAGQEWTLSVWTCPRRGKPHKALARTAYYRRVPSLPWLKPR